MIGRPPRSPPFPYTALFRSAGAYEGGGGEPRLGRGLCFGVVAAAADREVAVAVVAGAAAPRGGRAVDRQGAPTRRRVRVGGQVEVGVGAAAGVVAGRDRLAAEIGRAHV